MKRHGFDAILHIENIGVENLFMDEKKNWGRVIRGKLYERWPKDENGEPEEPAWLCNCANLNMGDELTINMLEAYGIPCLKIYPGDGEFGRLVLGMSGQGTDVLVPQSMLEDAKALLSGEAEIPEE